MTDRTDQYRWSSITEADAGAWAQLTNHLAVVDGTEEFYGPEDRLEELREENTDPKLDTIAVWHGEVMVGFGTVWVRPNPDPEGQISVALDGGVHADHRRQGIGEVLMQRLEARGAEAANARHPQKPFHFRTGGGLVESSARAFHLGRCYQVARHFHLMVRPLRADETAEQILPRPVPEGVVIRAPEPRDEQAVLEAHAAAFADHWGSAPPTAGSWAEQWVSRSNRHQVSRIAVDDSGIVLGYALCSQWVDRELYVNRLGTVPAARGQGVGTAVLAHTIEAAAASGRYDAIELDVDSESLTGATRLYERIGFTIKHTSALMQKHAA